VRQTPVLIGRSHLDNSSGMFAPARRALTVWR